MAQFDITQSLFGFTPTDVQRQLEQQQQQRDLALAQNPVAGFGAMGLQSLRRGTQTLQQGLFGVEPPEMAQANAIERAKQAALPALQSGGQLAYLDALAGEFERMGLTNQAVQARMLADQQRAAQAEQQSQIALRQAQAQKATQAQAGPQKGVVLPPGGRIVNPVTGRVIAEGTPQRTEGEKASPEAKRYNELLALGVPQEEARAIAYKTVNVDFKRELEESRQAERQERKEAQQSNIISTIDNIMNTIGTAEKQIGSFTAGTLGSPLSLIPGTSARDLAANLETIKANLGFDRLQQMRDASPTGGALGQVAIQELVALQSTVASLDNAQSPAQLRANLKKIQGHYQKWRDAVRKAQEQKQTTIGDLQPQTPSPAPTQPQPAQSMPQAMPTEAGQGGPRRLRFNPATGRAE